jgi:hypothetical protein
VDGNLNEAEIMDAQFDKDVMYIVPLDVKNLNQFPGKTFSSRPISSIKAKPPEITTFDIRRHELERNIP